MVLLTVKSADTAPDAVLLHRDLRAPLRPDPGVAGVARERGERQLRKGRPSAHFNGDYNLGLMASNL